MNKISSGKVFLLGLITLVGMGGLGFWLLSLSADLDIKYFFLGNPDISIYLQILIGLAIGAVFAYFAQYITTRPFFKETKDYYDQILDSINVNYFGMFFIAISAGIGEELMFRGFVQHWLGISVTAVLFVMLHGYLNPQKKPLFLYGIYVTFFAVIMGLLAKYLGIVSAMAAHFIFDFILLLYSANEDTKPEPDAVEDDLNKNDNVN